MAFEAHWARKAEKARQRLNPNRPRNRIATIQGRPAYEVAQERAQQEGGECAS